MLAGEGRLDAAKAGKVAGEIEATAHRTPASSTPCAPSRATGGTAPCIPRAWPPSSARRSTCAQRFVPFFTTKGIGKGTGLGLSVSKGLAEGHGGKLEFDATGPATRFTLTLRRTMDSAGD